jgi:hypothetical protein
MDEFATIFKLLYLFLTVLFGSQAFAVYYYEFEMKRKKWNKFNSLIIFATIFWGLGTLTRYLATGPADQYITVSRICGSIATTAIAIYFYFRYSAIYFESRLKLLLSKVVTAVAIFLSLVGRLPLLIAPNTEIAEMLFLITSNAGFTLLLILILFYVVSFSM